ncbi:MAG: S8 family serine peptidase [bacterium]|nr:S8 family serine peptidase [bacterium]
MLAETDPRLTSLERDELWRDYGLCCTFEWIVPESGFTYHELEVLPWFWLDRITARAKGELLAPRILPELIDQLNEDPRLHWAAPDALLLEFADSRETYAQMSAQVHAISAPYGASFIDENYRALKGGIAQWNTLQNPTDPLPDFEYYRLCPPEGVKIQWDLSLWDDPGFRARSETVYGTGQGGMLELYKENGSPSLNQVTIAVADTGVFMNHPDLSGRLHPNAIDANYSNYSIAQPVDRLLHDETVKNRADKRAVGLPRPAIQGRPASHGTSVAGIVARCTKGFKSGSVDAVRILPISIKSERSYAISGIRVKSPISAFLKVVACMYQEYPTGSGKGGKGNSKSGRSINDGDVRVVSTSASIPRSYFSGSEWRVVKPIAEKAAAAVAEDLRNNDRVWVFASGNDRQSEPSMPGEAPYVIAVTACMPFDPSKPWESAASGEAANLGEKCVAAPGYGIITSTLYSCPNLAYLPETEIKTPMMNFSVPPRSTDWIAHTNMFSATSAATPQVGALAALIYARKPEATYGGVINRIEMSCGERTIDANYGKSKGMVDYRVALAFD